VRLGVAHALGTDEASVRVIVPHVGGGFGLKANLYAEEIAVAALARRLGRPVRWIEDRTENLLAGTHGHDTRVSLRVAVGDDGRVHAIDADLVDVVHAACDAARRRAAGRRFMIHTPPSASASFDSARFRQVLDQVLDEAVLGTSEGARIEVRVEALAPRRLVQVTVRTHGNVEQRVGAVGLQLCRRLMQLQRGTLVSDVSSSGSLEVVMTLRGSPPSVRRRPVRARKAGRPAPIS